MLRLIKNSNCTRVSLRAKKKAKTLFNFNSLHEKIFTKNNNNNTRETNISIINIVTFNNATLFYFDCFTNGINTSVVFLLTSLTSLLRKFMFLLFTLFAISILFVYFISIFILSGPPKKINFLWSKCRGNCYLPLLSVFVSVWNHIFSKETEEFVTANFTRNTQQIDEIWCWNTFEKRKEGLSKTIW